MWRWMRKKASIGFLRQKKRGSLEREIPVPYPTHNMNIKKGGCYNVPNVVWFDKGEEHWYESSISMMARSFAIPRAKEYEKKGYLVRKKGVWRRIIFGMWELKWVTSKEREIIDHLKDKNLAAYIYVGHGLKGDPAGGLKPELKGQGAVNPGKISPYRLEAMHLFGCNTARTTFYKRYDENTNTMVGFHIQTWLINISKYGILEGFEVPTTGWRLRGGLKPKTFSGVPASVFEGPIPFGPSPQ